MGFRLTNAKTIAEVGVRIGGFDHIADLGKTSEEILYESDKRLARMFFAKLLGAGGNQLLGPRIKSHSLGKIWHIWSRPQFLQLFLFSAFPLVPELEEEEIGKFLQVFRRFEGIVPKDIGDAPEFFAERLEIKHLRHWGCPPRAGSKFSWRRRPGPALL